VIQANVSMDNNAKISKKFQNDNISNYTNKSDSNRNNSQNSKYSEWIELYKKALQDDANLSEQWNYIGIDTSDKKNRSQFIFPSCSLHERAGVWLITIHSEQKSYNPYQYYCEFYNYTDSYQNFVCNALNVPTYDEYVLGHTTTKAKNSLKTVLAKEKGKKKKKEFSSFEIVPKSKISESYLTGKGKINYSDIQKNKGFEISKIVRNYDNGDFEVPYKLAFAFRLNQGKNVFRIIDKDKNRNSRSPASLTIPSLDKAKELNLLPANYTYNLGIDNFVSDKNYAFLLEGETDFLAALNVFKDDNLFTVGSVCKSLSTYVIDRLKEKNINTVYVVFDTDFEGLENSIKFHNTVQEGITFKSIRLPKLDCQVYKYSDRKKQFKSVLGNFFDYVGTEISEKPKDNDFCDYLGLYGFDEDLKRSFDVSNYCEPKQIKEIPIELKNDFLLCDFLKSNNNVISINDFDRIEIKDNVQKIYLALSKNHKFFDTVFEFCKTNDIELILALPINLSAKELVNYGYNEIIDNDKIFNSFSLHSIHEENIFFAKRWIQNTINFTDTYEKILFDSVHIPKTILEDNENFRNALNPSNTEDKYINIKGGTGIGKNYAIKNIYANYYQNLGYLVMLVMPTNSLTKEQSENGEYYVYTSETKESVEKEIYANNYEVKNNLILSNYDNSLELFEYLTRYCKKKPIVFFDESDRLIKHSVFKEKVIDDNIKLMDLAEKVVFQSATPLLFGKFKTKDFFLDSTSKQAYNSIDLFFMAKTSYSEFIVNEILQNLKNNKRTLVFIDSISTLREIESILEKKNIDSLVCASKKVSNEEKEKITQMLVAGSYEWKKEEIEVILSTQIFEAGLSFYTDKDCEIIYANQQLIGIDTSAVLQAIARVRNYDKFNISYKLLTQKSDYFVNNEFQKPIFDYNFELGYAERHCKNFNRELAYRKKLGKDFKEFSNEATNEKYITYNSDKELFEVSYAKIWKAFYQHTVKNDSPYLLNINSIQDFTNENLSEEQENIKTLKKEVKEEKETEKQDNEKEIYTLVTEHFFETVNYLSKNTNDIALRSNLVSIRRNDIDFIFEVKTNIESLDMLQDFFINYFYFKNRLGIEEDESKTVINLLVDSDEKNIITDSKVKKLKKAIQLNKIMLHFKNPYVGAKDKIYLKEVKNELMNSEDEEVIKKARFELSVLKPINLSVSDTSLLKEYKRLILKFKDLKNLSEEVILKMANNGKRANNRYTKKSLLDTLKLLFDYECTTEQKIKYYSFEKLKDYQTELVQISEFFNSKK
jgi:hypothetical protein